MAKIQKMVLRSLVAFMVVSSLTLTPEQRFKRQITEQQQEKTATHRRLGTLTELVAENMLQNDETQNSGGSTLECRLHQKTGTVSYNILLMMRFPIFTPSTSLIQYHFGLFSQLNNFVTEVRSHISMFLVSSILFTLSSTGLNVNFEWSETTQDMRQSFPFSGHVMRSKMHRAQ